MPEEIEEKEGEEQMNEKTKQQGKVPRIQSYDSYKREMEYVYGGTTVELPIAPWLSENDQFDSTVRVKVPIPPWLSEKDEFDSTDLVDKVLLRIYEKIKGHPFWHRTDERKIRVDVDTVFVGDRKPLLVGIGPKQQDIVKLLGLKLKYLSSFVVRRGITVEKLLRANVRSHLYECLFGAGWAGPYDASIEAWVLDGCFIIELFSKYENDKFNSLFESERVLYALCQDLILPNNQMSGHLFKILINVGSHLEESNQDNDEKVRHFCGLARKFLQRITPNQKLYQPSINIDYFENLLSMVYDGLKWSLSHQPNDNVGDDKWNLLKSATELEEFGVKFKMKERESFIDITFTQNGVLEIPCIRIRYGTPYCIKILLEYEQNHHYFRYLSNYLWFMNNLVKSPKDVQLLRHKGIIDNLSELVDDVAIHKFLKDLYEFLIISRNKSSYIQVYRGLNLHCSHRRNIWKAKLKRDYFSSPWAFISFFAAFLLLILTITQTIFSIASYYNQDKYPYS